MNNTTSAEMLKRFEEITIEMLEVAKKKNNDYSGDVRAFKNFEVIEFLTNWYTTTEQGFLTRITDKASRIATLLNRDAQVADERVIDTLTDLSNYAVLMRIYLETKDSSQ